MSREARKKFTKEFKHLYEEKGYPKSRALAASYSVLRKKGYRLEKA